MQRSQRPLGRPRKEPHERSTKDTILQLATNMFLEKGYPLVSMDDVAQKSDVTKATVYYYYKTKADLFTDAMVQLMYRITQSITEILATDTSLKEQLHTLAKVHLQATIDIDINTFMKEAKHSLSDKQQQLMKEAEAKMYHVLKDGLQHAMNKGEVPQGNSHLAALIFISMLTAGNSVDNSNEEAVHSTDHLAMQIVNFFWYGLVNQK